MGRTYFLFIPLLFATLWLISGCNGSVETSSASANAIGNSVNHVELVELGERQYLLAKPINNFSQEKAYKLLLVFHGSGGSAESMRSLVKFEQSDDNYIVAYPQSKVEEWNEGCDCNKPHRLGIDDLAFVEALTADIKNKYNIIDDEVYAVGYSQGGLFTQNLMCNSSVKFNAIASIASPMSKPLSVQCQIANPTNYLLVHGTKDLVLPYQGQPTGNFALIGSEKAIALIAEQNGIDAPAKLVTEGEVTKHTYSNSELVNQLVSIKNGGHTWTFAEYDTSAEVLGFFNSVSDKPLDSHSSLYRVGEGEASKNIHVRSMGLEHTGPAIILLSGFNKNYHADSAWFSLLQPMLARTHRVHVIERLGNGFSSLSETPSYTSFAPLLDEVLLKLDEAEIVMVSFASGNLLAHSWYKGSDTKTANTLKGMLWIDPDILLPHSISLYQDWPVSWYRKVAADLLPHIEAGNWTERTLGKLNSEREAHLALISDHNKGEMDWNYYDQISLRRASITKQLIRAKEIMNYHDDLAEAMKLDITYAVPLSVIDTDFESNDIANAEDDVVDRLNKWQQEGSQWSKLIAERSRGQYIPLVNSDHMAVFEQPEQIIDAINLLTK